MDHDLPIIEPFRIKSVEPIRVTTRPEREAALERASGNLFRLKGGDVIIDLLTDSGTGAMSSEQWAAVMRGDESYAGSPSYQRFEQAVTDLFGFDQVIPTHQGRAAEHLLFQALVGPGDVVPNNTHFDTTRANVEMTGAEALDLPCPELDDTSESHPFKGNMDVVALEHLLAERRDDVPLVMFTITNNAAGGQPASLRNLQAVRTLCDLYKKPLFIDACRFAENAWLIKRREPDQHHREVRDIVRDIFALADGCTMSAKKDGLANIGGFLALRDADLALKFRQMLVVTEGFPTYGGMSGRDLEAVAQGLHEVIDEDYLRYRHQSIRYACLHMHEYGVPVVKPAGGHAVFLDAARFLPHVPRDEFPGHALAMELYLEGGLRTCEIGSVMLGHRDPRTGEETPARQELVRMAFPRRTYTQSHVDYVVEIVRRVWERRASIPGVVITEQPEVLRHFSARFGRAALHEQAGAGC